MHSFRPRTNADLPVIASWVPDAEALYAFAGPWMTWPFLPSDLDDLHKRPGATAWMLTPERASPSATCSSPRPMTLCASAD